MLLGIYPDPELVDQRVELRPGDSLVLFTDGLAERRDPHVDVPGEVRELLRSSAGSSAGEMAGRLGQLAISGGGKPDDDVAVVVLRRIHSGDGNGAATAPAPAPGKSIAAELEPGPGSPAEARAALSPLADALPPLVYMDLCLLVSELVTNSVRHAGLRPADLIRLQVETSDLVLRVEVSDPGEGLCSGPRPLNPTLTERLADRWGVDRDGEWTTVWLEVDIDQPGRTSG